MKLRAIPTVPPDGVNIGFTQGAAHDVDSSVHFLDLSREEENNVIVLSNRLVSGTSGNLPTDDVVVSNISVVRRDQTNPVSLYYRYDIGRGRYLVRLPDIPSNSPELARQRLLSALRIVTADGSLAIMNWWVDTPVWASDGWQVTIFTDRLNSPEQIAWVQYDAYDTQENIVARNRKEVINASPLNTGVSIALTGEDLGNPSDMYYRVVATTGTDYAPAIAIFPDAVDSPSVTVGTGTITINSVPPVDVTLGPSTPVSDVVSDINRQDADLTAVALNPSYQSSLVQGTYPTTGSTDGLVLRFDDLVQVKFNNSTRISADKPYRLDPEEPWYPRIRSGTVVQDAVFRWVDASEPNRGTGEVLFTVPDSRPYSPVNGTPYKDVLQERPFLLDPKTVRTRRAPLKSTSDIEVFLFGNSSNVIQDVDLETGTIFLRTRVESRDDITVDYTYEEKWYEYKGLDLNVLPAHDQSLLSKYVALFLTPSRVKLEGHTDPRFSDISQTLSDYVYHVIDDTYEDVVNRVDNIQMDLNEGEAGFPDLVVCPTLLLGVYRVTQNRDSDETVSIVDSRTRGGGVLDTKSINFNEAPEARMLGDHGYWDGEAFQANNTLIADLPDLVRVDLDTYPEDFDAETGLVWVDPTGRLTEEEMSEALHRHAAAGTLVIPEVDLIYPSD